VDIDDVRIKPEMVGLMDQACQAGRDKLGELVDEARRVVGERGPAALLVDLARREVPDGQ
jgi:hypothetical protein